MRKGLLAHWRRGIATRGIAGAAMLAVPVAVAATIGFGSSLSGLTEGLDALASGPEGTQVADAEAPEIDSAISALATATATAGGGGDGAPAPGTGGGGDGGGSPVEGTAPGSQGGSTTDTGTGTGGGGGGGGDATISPPDVNVPSTDTGVGDTVGGLLDGAGDTVDGVLGN